MPFGFYYIPEGLKGGSESKAYPKRAAVGMRGPAWSIGGVGGMWGEAEGGPPEQCVPLSALEPSEPPHLPSLS